MAFPHGLQAGINGGKGLSHPCGRLDEQVALSGNRAVHVPGQFLLTLPVGIWKGQLL